MKRSPKFYLNSMFGNFSAVNVRFVLHEEVVKLSQEVIQGIAGSLSPQFLILYVFQLRLGSCRRGQ